MNDNAKDKPDKPEIILSEDKLLPDLSAPHIKHGETTALIMSRVLRALLPALIWAVFIFGGRVITLTVISVISCVTFEFAAQKMMRRPVRINDLSAVVTGVLLALTLPVNAPLWAPAAGGAFAVVIVKQLFGGIGKNIVNPAIAARIFLSLSFNFMSVFQDIGEAKLPVFEINPDASAGATPLAYLKEGMPPGSLGILDMFLGQHAGSIGEVSALLLLAGGIYLIIRKVITWHIPLSFIGVVALISFLFPRSADHIEFALSQVLTGGLILGAVFMASDYSTSPVNGTGKLIFGAGCGLITIFIRYFGVYPEGVSFAIMIMNFFVWYIDKITKPVRFGGGKKNERRN
ncbi:MAG: RnfABCDGE type electron transport complex subunit D [Oscillospiraceae bacterium]|nr:RnfABCDGE type electron transport complex subunit D [Oscillospiraceae bacterium]